MGERAPPRPTLLEIGVASAPMAGETASGDGHLVRAFAGGELVVALDALGHGREAAASAERALAVLNANASDPIPLLVRRCHVALTGWRGVVLSLAVFDAEVEMLTWAGIGNVEGALVRAANGHPASRSGLITIGGIVGGDLPEVRPQQLPVGRGDVVVFATDGVRREFVAAVDPAQPPQAQADDLLARFSKGTDDALVLVVRYLGPPAR